MAIPATTIANYAPWGNAQLAFELGTGVTAIDSCTGNTIETTEIVEYLASLNIQKPSWQGKSGVDETTYTCQGRLLTPATFDTRITNGTQADCLLNGLKGRLELSFELAMDAYHYGDLRQSIEGVFRVVGGIA
jgi:hypothetical protein